MNRLPRKQYDEWLVQHRIIEQDGYGPKVILCKNGCYIKIFRIKHLISFSRLVNPAVRFCRNALRLQKLGFDTLKPVESWYIPHLGRWAVCYEPLPGDTLRSLIGRFSLPEPVIEKLGILIADLHNKGVYFRSLHLGNVVLQPDGKLGVIDILDCRFRWFRRPLNENQRQRNFRHLFRYDDARLIEDMIRTAYTKARQHEDEKARTGSK